jgi:hypothetical protein
MVNVFLEAGAKYNFFNLASFLKVFENFRFLFFLIAPVLAPTLTQSV